MVGVDQHWNIQFVFMCVSVCCFVFEVVWMFPPAGALDLDARRADRHLSFSCNIFRNRKKCA